MAHWIKWFRAQIIAKILIQDSPNWCLVECFISRIIDIPLLCTISRLNDRKDSKIKSKPSTEIWWDLDNSNRN